MTNTHDDLAARLAEIRSRHNSTWTDYDKDDIASDAMARGFEWLKEQQRLGKLPPPPPRPTRPKKSLVEALLEIGCVDGRDKAR